MTVNTNRLVAAGPRDAEHGFPMWYEDESGTRLDLGLGPDPMLPAIGVTPHPGQPLAIPGNFPDEVFYFMAESRMDVGGAGTVGRARLILALEAAFGGNGEPDPEARIVFARIRIRMDDLIPGAPYTVTHPYGVTGPLFADGGGRVFVTDDRGVGDEIFDAVVRTGRVAPFLRWATGAPAGYLGDGVTERPITGSPFNTNFFRVDGPNIADGGGPRDPGAPTNNDRVQNDLFTVQGRLATRAGVRLDRAAYSRNAAGETTLAIHASSDAGQHLELDVPHAPLAAEQTSYAAHVAVGAVPADVTVVNTSDTPASRATAPVADLVMVDEAVWDAGTGQLTVAAHSSDATVGTLEAQGFGPFPVGSHTFTGVAAVPADIHVVSSAGGATSRPVRVTGMLASPQPPVADAGIDQAVAAGRLVVLDGSGSRGATSWTWTQQSGTGVVLTPSGARATFTPTAPDILTFQLAVTGPDGAATDTVTVTVTPPAPPDTVTVQRSQYRTGRRQFRVSGQCTGPIPNEVTVTFRGRLLGVGAVDVTNAWSVVQTLTGDQQDLVPEPGDALHVASGHGGSAEAAISIRT